MWKKPVAIFRSKAGHQTGTLCLFLMMHRCRIMMWTSGGVSSNQYTNMTTAMPSPLQAMAAHRHRSRCKGLQFNGMLTRGWLYALSNTMMVSHLSGSFSPGKSSTFSSADYILKHYMTSIHCSLMISLLLLEDMWERSWISWKQLLPMT